LLVERALLHLDALDGAERVAAAAADGLEHHRDRLRVDRWALLAFRGRARAQRYQEVAHQLRALRLHFEHGPPILQSLDTRLEVRFAPAERARPADVAHRDLADADAGVGFYPEAAHVEVRRQPGQLDSARLGRHGDRALDGRAARVQSHAADAALLGERAHGQ